MMCGVSAPASSAMISLLSWPGAKGPNELAQLPGSLEIFLQFRRDLFGDIGAGAAEFGAQALLRGGPDHVAVFVHEADGGYGFVPPLGRVLRFVLANADPPIASAGAPCSAARPAIGMRVNAIGRGMDLGENQVFGGAAKRGVGTVR